MLTTFCILKLQLQFKQQFVVVGVRVWWKPVTWQLFCLWYLFCLGHWGYVVGHKCMQSQQRDPKCLLTTCLLFIGLESSKGTHWESKEKGCSKGNCQPSVLTYLQVCSISGKGKGDKSWEGAWRKRTPSGNLISASCKNWILIARFKKLRNRCKKLWWLHAGLFHEAVDLLAHTMS